MSGVRVPSLNPAIWRFALGVAGEGALLWRDPAGAIAAFNMVHRSGSEGWMGPLAVRPERQASGLGTVIVQAGIRLLQQGGASVIGLETMPRTIDNIGFYSRLGFRPGHLTLTVTREITGREGEGAPRLSQAGSEERRWVEACRALAGEVAGGADYSREVTLTREQELGDTTLVCRGDRLVGFALWHAAALAEGRLGDELRVLKLVAQDLDALRRVIGALVHAAASLHLRRVSIRCQSAFAEAYAELLAAGFRVHWTDLRMSLASHPERQPDQGVVFSNWEI